MGQYCHQHPHQKWVVRGRKGIITLGPRSGLCIYFIACTFSCVQQASSIESEAVPDRLVSRLILQFRELIRAALKAGIFVAIVTFSIQTDLIIDALKHVFPACCRKIPVFGNDKSWDCSCAMMREFYKKEVTKRDGKLPHMCAAAASSAKRKCKKPIIFSDVLLIDDDKDNITSARAQGVRACWLCVTCICCLQILSRIDIRVLPPICHLRLYSSFLACLHTGVQTLQMPSFGN